METPLDRAHAAMAAAQEDDRARLGFYERLADAELHLLLASESEGDDIVPRLFELEQGNFLLAFDREERLSAFVGIPAPRAVLSGRALVASLAGKQAGLALNLGAPSEYLIPASAIDWLSGVLSDRPSVVEARPREFHRPTGLPDGVIEALSVKLATAEGLAESAWLAAVAYDDGRRGHLLAFTGTVPGAERALAGAVAEALTFSGVEAGELDVAFLQSGDPAISRLLKVGVGFEIPKAAEPSVVPGADPGRPPRLR